MTDPSNHKSSYFVLANTGIYVNRLMADEDIDEGDARSYMFGASVDKVQIGIDDDLAHDALRAMNDFFSLIMNPAAWMTAILTSGVNIYEVASLEITPGRLQIGGKRHRIHLQLNVTIVHNSYVTRGANPHGRSRRPQYGLDVGKMTLAFNMLRRVGFGFKSRMVGARDSSKWPYYMRFARDVDVGLNRYDAETVVNNVRDKMTRPENRPAWFQQGTTDPVDTHGFRYNQGRPNEYMYFYARLGELDTPLLATRMLNGVSFAQTTNAMLAVLHVLNVTINPIVEDFTPYQLVTGVEREPGDNREIAGSSATQPLDKFTIVPTLRNPTRVARFLGSYNQQAPRRVVENALAHEDIGQAIGAPINRSLVGMSRRSGRVVIGKVVDRTSIVRGKQEFKKIGGVYAEV